MEEAIKKFKEYTANYINLSDMCVSKVNHTMRVMELCGVIAESLGLSKEDIELAKLCGLVHDIARFEQWRRYQTFTDARSVDHGNLGVEILCENNFIREFNADSSLDDLILKTVKNHNKYSIDPELTERESLFCNIVRDADKLDILYLYTTGEINLNTNNEDFSDEVYDCLLSNKPIYFNIPTLRNIKKTKADNLAVSLGFVFDFNFPISYHILKDRGYSDKEIEIYKSKSNNLGFKVKLEDLKDILNKYIDGKIEKSIYEAKDRSVRNVR